MTDIFTTFEAAKILKVKYGRLREWIDREYILCSQRAEGQGGKTLFDRYNLYIMGLFVYLLEKGFNREEASERVKGVDKYLRATNLWDKPEAHTYIAIVSRPEVERESSRSVLSIVRDVVDRPGPEVHIPHFKIMSENRLPALWGMSLTT